MISLAEITSWQLPQFTEAAADAGAKINVARQEANATATERLSDIYNQQLEAKANEYGILSGITPESVLGNNQTQLDLL